MATGGMYKLPSCVEGFSSVDLPTCMYKLPNLQEIAPEEVRGSDVVEGLVVLVFTDL